MAGLLGGSHKSTSKARDEALTVDNYALFFQRIEEAQAAIRSKLAQNERRLSFLRQQLALARSSRAQWNENIETVDGALSLYQGDTKGYEYLAGLLESGRTMESAAASQCALIENSINSLESQETPLMQNLNRLSASKGKLVRTQTLERAQRNLSDAVRNSGGGGIINAEPLDEMREVRRLIAETEALVELKG